MRIFVSILIFYKKLIIPTLTVAILIACLGISKSETFSLPAVGFSYIFLTPLFHYFIYELRNPNEYFFYYNFGLSKLILWVSSLTISIVVGLILILV